MVSSLVVARIDLNWADEQYWVTLTNVIRDMNKSMQPKEKRKLKVSEAQKFIK